MDVVVVVAVELAKVGEADDGIGKGNEEVLLGQGIKTYFFVFLLFALQIDHTMTIYCSHCARIVRMNNIGALIPDDEIGERTYCENCTLNAIDDLYKRKEAEALV